MQTLKAKFTKLKKIYAGGRDADLTTINAIEKVLVLKQTQFRDEWKVPSDDKCKHLIDSWVALGERHPDPGGLYALMLEAFNKEQQLPQQQSASSTTSQSQFAPPMIFKSFDGTNVGDNQSNQVSAVTTGDQLICLQSDHFSAYFYGIEPEVIHSRKPTKAFWSQLAEALSKRRLHLFEVGPDTLTVHGTLAAIGNAKASFKATLGDYLILNTTGQLDGKLSTQPNQSELLQQLHVLIEVASGGKTLHQALRQAYLTLAIQVQHRKFPSPLFAIAIGPETKSGGWKFQALSWDPRDPAGAQSDGIFDLTVQNLFRFTLRLRDVRVAMTIASNLDNGGDYGGDDDDDDDDDADARQKKRRRVEKSKKK